MRRLLPLILLCALAVGCGGKSASDTFAQAQIGARITVEPDLPAALQFIPDLAHRLGDFETLAGNRVELLPDYTGTIDRIIGDIDAAQQHVHLLFYIFLADQTGNRVAEALGRASARGVNCRVLMDAVGSSQGLQRLASKMRKRGVEVLEMLPVGLFRRNAARFDLRNHRKIVVIDGRVGYTGSQNIVNPEFVKGYPNEELMVRVVGPVVADGRQGPVLWGVASAVLTRDGTCGRVVVIAPARARF